MHSNGLKAHVSAALAKPRGVRLVWQLHDYVQSRPLSSVLLRRLSHRADAIVANSDSVLADASAVLTEHRGLRRIYNAVDLSRFCPDGPSLNLAALSGLPDEAGRVRIGLVATLARWKGHDVFIDAIAKLTQPDRIRAYIVGGAVYETTGSQRSLDELRRAVAERGLSGVLGFTGHVDDVPGALRGLDIVVHASTAPEPFGMVIAEAMATGRAVVAVRSGGAAELFDDGVTAIGYTAGDAGALAERLDGLVSDAARRATIGAAAREAAQQWFAPERMAAEFREVYRGMISTALCGIAFLLCLQMGRRSLVAGLCSLLTVGYLYGLLRANLPDGISHLIFDAGVLGLYAAQLTRPQPLWQRTRSEDLRNWVLVLMLWPALLFVMLWQDPLIQLVGLRGAIFLLPFLLLGARLTGDDVYKLGLWLAVLNLSAGAFAIVQFFVGIEPFFPRNAATEIIYRSKDLANYTAYRIPSSFSSAHAYAGTMVITMVLIAASWVQQHYGRWQSRLLGSALFMSMLGVFMSATRVNALMLFVLVVATIFIGRVPAAYRFRWLILLAILGYAVSGDERLQRFRTLQDPELLAERIVGSVNMTFIELVRQFPLGNGLGGGGTSVPYFLQDRIRNPVMMENEYARILLELGLPGLAMWTLFLGWVFTRRRIQPSDMFHFGRRLAFVACACSFATGLIGLGLFTSIPATSTMLLLTGWFVSPEVAFAPVAEPMDHGVVAPSAVNYGRAG